MSDQSTAQTPDLTFYTNPMSRGRIVRWMLEEVAEPYETVVLDYGPAMKGADYLGVNPMGKVPALRHGAHVVTEAAAICTYLAETFPGAGLRPDDALLAPYYRWMFFAAGPLEAAVTNASFGWVAEGPQNEGRIGYGSLDRVVGALEQFVAGASPYLLGERFTALDVYLGSQILWGLQFRTIPERPVFRDYAGRIAGRPAAVKARATDDALMPPNPAAV